MKRGSLATGIPSSPGRSGIPRGEGAAVSEAGGGLNMPTVLLGGQDRSEAVQSSVVEAFVHLNTDSCEAELVCSQYGIK